MYKKLKKLKTYPKHIAFIMDGNRRWAKNRGLDKMMGHRQGAIALQNIMKTISELKEIKYVSVFAWSTENWNREQREKDYFFELVKEKLLDKEKFLQQNMRFVSMGDISRFSEDLQEALTELMEKTKNNTGLTIFMGLNYGGRDDIVHSANKLLEKNQPITSESLQQNLYCPYDIDLLVRTSGEQRVSNFMLYQMAYSEFYFAKKHWPSFDDKQLYKALRAFSKRNRRFGGK